MKPLKSYLTYAFSIGLLLVYLMGTMGVGTHECTHNHQRSVILFFGEDPCEYLHSHIDSNGHIYTHSHAPQAEGLCGCGHSDCPEGKSGFNLKEEGHNGCCTTTAYVLSHEQVSQHNLSVDAPQFLIVSTLQKSCIAEAAMEQQAILLQRAWNTAGGESLPQSVVLSKIGLYLI